MALGTECNDDHNATRPYAIPPRTPFQLRELDDAGAQDVRYIHRRQIVGRHLTAGVIGEADLPGAQDLADEPARLWWVERLLHA